MNISLKGMATLSLASVLSACTSGMRDGQRQQSTATVDRMYVIECGEAHTKDISLWTTAADKGKAYSATIAT